MAKHKNVFVALMCVVVGLVIGQIISNTIFFTSYVIGDSMNPTYTDGDLVFVYMLDNPDRGDIIVVDEGDKYVIKRCIGMPGDTIEMHEGVVYINGAVYSEPYILDCEESCDAGILESPVHLGDGEYFMLGDNRMISKDSRHIGVITREQIVGVVQN